MLEVSGLSKPSSREKIKDLERHCTLGRDDNGTGGRGGDANPSKEMIPKSAPCLGSILVVAKNCGRD